MPGGVSTFIRLVSRMALLPSKSFVEVREAVLYPNKKKTLRALIKEIHDFLGVLH
jgi:predicted component of type VI protein secretion system